MKSAFSKFFFLGLLLFFPCFAFPQESSKVLEKKIQRIVAQIKEETGVEVIYKDLPALVRAELRFNFASESDYSTLKKFLELLRAELHKYPKSFWKKFFNPKMILVKKHFYHDKPAEGLFTAKADVILLDFSRSRRNPIAQSHNIHHEIFHQIDFHLHGPAMIKDEAWESFNPRGFLYGQKEDHVTRSVGQDPLGPPHPGFVTDYATTLVTEDKAEIFACLMVPSQNKIIQRWAKKDQILQRKIDAIKTMVKNFCGEMVL